MAPPNLYHLSGAQLHIGYTTSDITGQSQLTYQDDTRSLSFTGNEIESATTEAGTLVSVPIVRTVDTGSTTFSFLLPDVNIEPIAIGVPSSISTYGITAIHRIGSHLNRGQLDTYTVTRLRGSAQIVET